MQLTKELLGTTDAYIKKLARGGIHTVADLLSCYPKDIEDTSQVLDHFAYINVQEKNTIKVTVANIKKERTKYQKTLVKIIVSDSASQLCECVFFRSPWMLTQLQVGQTIIIKGKPKYEYGKLSFPQPEIEIYKEDRQALLPVYSDIQGVGAKWLASKIPLLQSYLSYLPEIVPSEVSQKRGFLSRHENVASLHFPKSKQDFERAKRELAYEELWQIQHDAMLRKLTIQDESE